MKSDKRRNNLFFLPILATFDLHELGKVIFSFCFLVCNKLKCPIKDKKMKMTSWEHGFDPRVGSLLKHQNKTKCCIIVVLISHQVGGRYCGGLKVHQINVYQFAF